MTWFKRILAMLIAGVWAGLGMAMFWPRSIEVLGSGVLVVVLVWSLATLAKWFNGEDDG